MYTNLVSPRVSKLKVAVCFSGFPRNYEKTFSRMKSHLFDICHPDIFYAGYNEVDGKVDEKLLELYQPKKYLFRDYDLSAKKEINDKFQNYQPTYLHPTIKLEKFKSQFYNIYIANQLKIAYERENDFQYDIVIRCRPDYYFFRDITSDDLNLGLDGGVVIPDEWDFKEVNPHGVSDCFAYSSSKSMDTYSLGFFYFPRYGKEDNILFHPETLIGYHLFRSRLKRVVIKRHFKYETPDGEHNERYKYNPN